MATGAINCEILSLSLRRDVSTCVSKQLKIQQIKYRLYIWFQSKCSFLDKLRFFIPFSIINSIPCAPKGLRRNCQKNELKIEIPKNHLVSVKNVTRNAFSRKYSGFLGTV